MSAKRFLQHLQNDTGMQAALSGENWSLAAIVNAGAAAGFEFTAEEYRTAYRELASQELAVVAGGGCNAGWKQSKPNLL